MNVSHAVVAIFLAAFPMCATALDYAGTVKTIKGDVSVERADARLIASPGMPIQPGDRIVTGSEGYAGVTMKDDTLLTLGPSSSLKLESYKFDPKTHEGNFAAYLGRGILSVVTGLIPKVAPDAFLVRTRVSTMGVRGTEFVVEAND
jgi:hypothetical protein